METEEIAAKLNQRWRELSEDDQLVYREKAAVEHDEVAQKQLNYEAELKTWKEAGGVLDDDVESNAPPKAPLKPVKRAATAYFLFSSEKRQQLRTEVSNASHRRTRQGGTVSHLEVYRSPESRTLAPVLPSLRKNWVNCGMLFRRKTSDRTTKRRLRNENESPKNLSYGKRSFSNTRLNSRHGRWPVVSWKRKQAPLRIRRI